MRGAGGLVTDLIVGDCRPIFSIGVSMQRFFAVLFVFLLFGQVTGAAAADAAQMKKLVALKKCLKCDLSAAALSFASLKNADLSGSNLSGANLNAADLSGANLKNTNLSNANLSEADLNGADLDGADLKGANLYSVNLLRANLSNADLSTATNAGKIAVREALLCKTKLADGVESRDCK